MKLECLQNMYIEEKEIFMVFFPMLGWIFFIKPQQLDLNVANEIFRVIAN